MTRAARLALAGLLLLPWSGAAHAEASCAIQAPPLAVDLARACETVRAAVPGWDGRATVRLGPGDPSVAGETSGTTVTLHAAAWSTLTAAGRQVVLTHELVHVATGPLTTARTPQWLVEGLPEAIALRGSGLPDRVVARELAAAPRPQALPRAVVDPVSYEESWLAVDLLARRYGMPAVLRLYEAAGNTSLDRSLAPLGLTPPELTAIWRAELVDRLS